jgi:hypothetical protein
LNRAERKGREEIQPGFLRNKRDRTGQIVIPDTARQMPVAQASVLNSYKQPLPQLFTSEQHGNKWPNAPQNTPFGD